MHGPADAQTGGTAMPPNRRPLSSPSCASSCLSSSGRRARRRARCRARPGRTRSCRPGWRCCRRPWRRWRGEGSSLLVSAFALRAGDAACTQDGRAAAACSTGPPLLHPDRRPSVSRHSSHAEVRGELSPLKRQARHLEAELELARQEGQVRGASGLGQPLATAARGQGWVPADLLCAGRRSSGLDSGHASLALHA